MSCLTNKAINNGYCQRFTQLSGKLLKLRAGTAMRITFQHVDRRRETTINGRHVRFGQQDIRINTCQAAYDFYVHVMFPV
jgi:hypothetical protein